MHACAVFYNMHASPPLVWLSVVQLLHIVQLVMCRMTCKGHHPEGTIQRTGSWCTHRHCCLLCRVTVNDMLVRADLGRFFQAFVTAEDGMDTISQRFLSASIKLGRPPNQCVVFESSPAGITAAHNCTMKVNA